MFARFGAPLATSAAALCLAAVVPSGLSLSGCTDTSNTLVTTETVTLVTVDPQQFLGEVVCGTGGIQTYVVSLFDARDPTAPVAVSSPTPCTHPVSFGSPPVQVGNSYVAAVQGFDRADVQLTGDASLPVVDPAGQPIAARFTTTCGDFTPGASSDGSTAAAPADPNHLRQPTMALLSTEVFVKGCLQLRESANMSDASTTPDEEAGLLDAGSQGDAENDGSEPAADDTGSDSAETDAAGRPDG